MKIISICIVLLLSSCNSFTEKSKESIWNSIDEKEEMFIENSKIFHNPENINEDFIGFYNKFISDSIFQKDHIENASIAVIAECDTTIQLVKSNWEIINWDLRNDFNNPLDSNIIFQDSAKFYYKSIRKEVGVSVQLGFEKIKGEWYLTLLMVSYC